jgi:hypothetical protein
LMTPCTGDAARGGGYGVKGNNDMPKNERWEFGRENLKGD